MFTDAFFVLIIILYMALLFTLAYVGDRRAESGRSLLRFSILYALSIAVYCTDWTFYGSVGSAVAGGPGFLPVYLGPTLAAPLWWFVLRKEIRIAKTYKITSLSDFVSSRYAKSALVGGLVAGFMVLGMLPYISLQLKGISASYNILTHRPENLDIGFFSDTAFYAAIVLAVFVIVFGTRHLDASERHEGMVLTVAFESMIKLFAFLILGFYVVFVLYDGPSGIIGAASSVEGLKNKLTFGGDPGTWFTVLLLSASAIMFLPHTFQTAVLENVDVGHVKTAMWGFPLYLFLINLFVMPIAFGGAVLFAGEGINTDTYVLNLPRVGGSEWLALLVFLGGLSAGSGMVIVATIALATMVSNNIVMPFLLRYQGREMSRREDLSGLILGVRRLTILLIILSAYLYFKYVSRHFTLISTGLTSFTAVAQLAPIILGGLFWKGANRTGALWGLTVGIGLWAYTLIMPMAVQAGIFPASIMTEGLFGIYILRPTALFGLEGLDIIPHGAFWSLSLNTLFFIFGSSFSQTSALGHRQADLFVDVFKAQTGKAGSRKANLGELIKILNRFVGKEKTAALVPTALTGVKHSGEKLTGIKLVGDYDEDGDDGADSEYYIDSEQHRYEQTAGTEIVEKAETLLAGTIGAASARVLMQTVIRDESLGINEVMSILDESREIKEYSRKLEQASKQIEDSLKEIRHLKEQQDGDYFLATLLIKPLGVNAAGSKNVQVEFLVREKKQFQFRQWKSEIGGDINIAHSIRLRNNPYTVYLNADAMGKSMQGAGGVLVLGSVFQSIIERTKMSPQVSQLAPERWLKQTFVEMHRVFETFSGSMLVSVEFGLISESLGLMYSINAEHPTSVLYRQGRAQFLQNAMHCRKLGTQGVNDKAPHIKVNRLQHGDVVILGSDGRDDILIGEDSQGKRIVNEDEHLFLEIVEESRADLQEIYRRLQIKGEIMDDLALMKISYTGPRFASGDDAAGIADVIGNARRLCGQGEEEQALNLLKDSLKQDWSRQVSKEIVKVLLRSKQYQQAKPFVLDYLGNHPEDTEMLFAGAFCLKKTSDLFLAADFSERVRLRNPKLAQNLLNLAEVYILSGNTTRAWKILNEILVLEPDHDRALRYLESLSEPAESEDIYRLV